MKKWKAGLSLLAGLFLFAACGTVPPAVHANPELPVNDHVGGGAYDRALFYRNGFAEVNAQDPSALYVTEGAEQGYVYVYGTTEDTAHTAVQAWKSSDMRIWRHAGVVYEPPRAAWAEKGYSSPKVVYRAAEQRYYLYYSAMNKANGLSGIGVAVSDSPKGPFLPFEGKDAYGRTVETEQQTIDFARAMSLPDGFTNLSARDPQVFTDTDGKEYLLFASGSETAGEIWGAPLLDAVTPDYAALTRLTEYGKAAPGGSAVDYDAAGVNRAPVLLLNNGTYVLTYATGAGSSYKISYAEAQSPLGAYEKKGVCFEAAQNAAGTGTHAFLNFAGERWVFYGAAARVGAPQMCFDRFRMTDGFGGVQTTTLQPAPGVVNAAAGAAVSEAALADGNVTTEAAFSGKTTFTVEFSEATEIRAILIYNSGDKAKAFAKVDLIELTVPDGSIQQFAGTDFDNVLTVTGLRFDEAFLNRNAVLPGAAAVAEFRRLAVTKIAVTIDAEAFAVSELFVVKA